MTNIFNIFAILFFIFTIQKDPRYNKRGIPSSWGIKQYIENNQENLIAEYEYKVDSLYDVYIFAEDLRKEPDYDSMELGRFYIPDYVYITTEEKFVEYEFKYLSKSKQKNFKSTDNTVKGVLFHELSHAYFHQTIMLLRMNDELISPEYGLVRIFPNPSLRYGAEFIEEGFCEYMVEELGEQPINNLEYIPKTIDDLMHKENITDIKYRYSVHFLRDFFNHIGIEKGLKIILQNRPPNYEEILNSSLYFRRIMLSYQEEDNIANISIINN